MAESRPHLLSFGSTQTHPFGAAVLQYASSCLKWLIALFFREQGYRGCESKQLRSNRISAPFEECETITEISGAAQRWLTVPDRLGSTPNKLYIQIWCTPRPAGQSFYALELKTHLHVATRHRGRQYSHANLTLIG